MRKGELDLRILYWDAFAGISGDMALGSLIALGADPEKITAQLQGIGLTGFELKITSRQIEGIMATDVDVQVDSQDVHHRHLADIERMIQSGGLTKITETRALTVFHTLAEAEAKVHGTTVAHVHFHEVGAIDALVDIVGTAIALEQLNIEEIKVSVLPWSNGFVQCAHGTLPLPAPATVELLAGFRFRESGITGELITPTGAALISALGEQSPFPEMTLVKAGYGAGKNYYGIPNLLRGVLGEQS